MGLEILPGNNLKQRLTMLFCYCQTLGDLHPQELYIKKDQKKRTVFSVGVSVWRADVPHLPQVFSFFAADSHSFQKTLVTSEGASWMATLKRLN